MARGDARPRLLDAAVGLIRERGFADTSVDDLCRAAGVTKGAFFHHFESKEALGVAAAEHWTAITAPLFASAPYHNLPDPAARVLAYVAFRRAMLDGPIPQFTCLAGTMAQEAYDTHPDVAAACGASIVGHAHTLVDDVRAAMAAHGVTGFTAESLALHTQAVLQGAFVLAKATGSVDVARDSVDHLTRYLTGLFGPSVRPNPESP